MVRITLIVFKARHYWQKHYALVNFEISCCLAFYNMLLPNSGKKTSLKEVFILLHFIYLCLTIHL